MADMEGHFADGMAAGRSEHEIAAALGDPSRLARELRADAGIKQWEEKRNASSAVTAVFAILGLGAIDLLVLLPVLFVLGVVAFVIYVCVFAGLIAGFAILIVSFVTITPNGVAPHGLEGVLEGLALISGSVAWGALHTLICIGLVNALVWYAKLHIKVIKPAVEG